MSTITVGEMARQSMAAVRAFERLGIDYCCGGKRPLEEVCRERGIELEAVSREIEKAAAPGAATDWNTAPLGALIRHIVGTHHEFLKFELRRISERVAKVVAAHGDKDARLEQVQTVFEGLRQELMAHLHKEEEILFPRIEKSAGGVEAPISVMEAEHDEAGQALEQLRELTDGYRVPEWACNTYRALLEGLRELEADLHVHIHLENNILFPRAMGH